MKKLLVIALAVVMMMAMGLSVAAEISPEAPVISGDGDTNDSPTSPQTGHTFVIVAAGAAIACLTVGGVAAKKLIAE